MKLNFSVKSDLSFGIEHLKDKLGYEISEDGIRITAEEGSRLGVSFSDGEATVYYQKKHQFFRELCLLVGRLKESDLPFDITEDTHFETVSAMIDASRCAVPTVKTAKELIIAKAKQILIPLFCWSFVSLIVHIIKILAGVSTHKISLVWIFQTILSGFWGGPWFLWAIWWCSLIHSSIMYMVIR